MKTNKYTYLPVGASHHNDDDELSFSFISYNIAGIANCCTGVGIFQFIRCVTNVKSDDKPRLSNDGVELLLLLLVVLS